MSALYRNTKKKLTQIELRKYMNEHKNKNKEVTKIDSPLAKYTENGQLMCILCQSIVRSEAVWTIHLNAKQHKENIMKAKKLKDELKTGHKRTHTPDPEEPPKKLKSILKNSVSANNLPEGFFVSSSSSNQKKKEVKDGCIPKTEECEPMEVVPQKEENTDTLPEGFFDDPKLDAKARNLEYKDPAEEEWERFQREIKEVDHQSAEIIAEDQEEATTERQIAEIDEQMRNWSRVLDWEKKKSEVKIPVVQEVDMEEEGNSDQDENFEEYLDWRAKKSFN